MSERKKAILCFQWPEEGSYFGGIVTMCNDYLDKSDIFKENGVDLSYFNYKIPEGSIWDKPRNSKLRNLIYGYLQGKALNKYLEDNPDCIIHIHTSRKALFFKDVLLASRIRRRCKEKIIMTIHVGDISTVFHNDATKKFLIRQMNKSIDKVLFLSDRMRKQFVDSGLDPFRTEVLYNFFNIRPLSLDDKISGQVPYLLYLGSINREKGIIELLRAAHSLKEDFHLDVCGSILEESIRSEFESLLKELGPKVTYHGYIGKDKKEEILRSADILLLPSYREGLPISILEAMATSCAVITTPVGAIPEILTADNAVIVEPRNIPQLESAVRSLLNDGDRLRRMQKANYSVSARFNVEKHIQHLCQLYTE